MGWFDGASDVGSSHHRKSSSSKHHSSHSHHHHSSSPRASSIFGVSLGEPAKEHHRSHSHSRSSHGHDKPRSSAAAFFGFPEPSRSHSHSHDKPRGSSIFGGGDAKHNSSRSSFFGFGGHRSSSSHYKRSPRQGYVKRVYSQLRRLLRDLIHYMKKHPMKVFMLVIMPLITGGALTTLLAKFGLRLPASVQKMFGGMNGAGSTSRGGGSQWEHSKVSGSGPLAGLGSMASAMGGMGGISGAMSLAKLFM